MDEMPGKAIEPRSSRETSLRPERDARPSAGMAIATSGRCATFATRASLTPQIASSAFVRQGRLQTELSTGLGNPNSAMTPA